MKKGRIRGLIIGIIWTLIYFPWLFFFLRANWNFVPTRMTHWLYLRFEWLHGWVISTPREWVFIITLFFAIPMWIIGFILLYKIPYKKVFWAILLFPKRLLGYIRAPLEKQNSTALSNTTERPEASKKTASHREKRPPMIRTSLAGNQSGEKTAFKEIETGKALESSRQNAPEKRETETRRSFSDTSSKYSSSGGSGGSSGRTKSSKPILETPEEKSIFETLTAAKYEVLEKVQIGQNMFSYVGIGPQSIMICLIDDAKGDWLADEEMFGSEPPLWFSESSHKTSPAYVVLRTAEHLKSVYNTKPETRHLDVYAFLIFCEGNIINADDMIETWRKQSVSVCRARNGKPATLPELEPILPENDRGELTEELRTLIKEGFEKMTVKI